MEIGGTAVEAAGCLRVLKRKRAVCGQSARTGEPGWITNQLEWNSLTSDFRPALQLIPARGRKAAAAEPSGRFVKMKSHLAVHSHNPGDDRAEEIDFIGTTAAD